MINTKKIIIIAITILIGVGLAYPLYTMNHKNDRPNTKSYDLYSMESSKNMLLHNHEVFDEIIQYFMNKKIRVIYDFNQKGEIDLIQSEPEITEDQEENLRVVQDFVNKQRGNGILPTNRGGAMEFGYRKVKTKDNTDEMRYYAHFRMASLEGISVDFIYEHIDDYTDAYNTARKRTRMMPHWYYHFEDLPDCIEFRDYVRFSRAVAHKIGHVGDMMRNNGMVTSNDIEMLLLAWKENDSQYFVDERGHENSQAIRGLYYNYRKNS